MNVITINLIMLQINVIPNLLLLPFKNRQKAETVDQFIVLFDLLEFPDYVPYRYGDVSYFDDCGG